MRSAASPRASRRISPCGPSIPRRARLLDRPAGTGTEDFCRVGCLRSAAAAVAAICWAALVIQFNATLSQTGSAYAALWIILRFFTVTTNLLVAAAMTKAAFNDRVPPVLLGGATVAILLVGVVYMTIGTRARQAARLSRQREHQPEAAGRARRDGRLLSARQREHPSRDAPAQRAGDRRCTKARAPRPQPSSTRRTRKTHRSDKGHDRRHQPRRAELWPVHPPARATRSSSPGSSTTRTSCPWQMLVRADRARRCASRRSTTRGELDLERVRGLLSPRTRIVAIGHVSNALGTVNPVARDHRAGARARRGRAGRRRAGACRTSPSTCRRSTATSTRSRATRCTARPASACSTARRALLEAMPPYQGGGDMIASVTFEKTHLQRRCRTSSRPARRTSPASSGFGAAIDYI